MTDNRELLELAAKAAGIKLYWREQSRGYFLHPIDERDIAWGGTPRTWNPIYDDGDALRLACKLRMSLNFSTAKNGPDTAFSEGLEDVITVPITKWMDTESMRLAIVRAAAEIGKQMENNSDR